jgi:uncharacterized protein (TIGR02996 family)
MTLVDPFEGTMLDGEDEWLARVTADLLDDDQKLVYADWLEEHGSDRASYLRQLVTASKSMKADDLPESQGVPPGWNELIGGRLIELLCHSDAAEIRDKTLTLARPALRMNKDATPDQKISVGASKSGGFPDLPPGFKWPPGGDCHAIYNDDTGGTELLAGFLAQVNLEEIASSQAALASGIPKSGVLSFFCFQDFENDNPDAIGALCLHFTDAGSLVRTEPPDELTEGNGTSESAVLRFEETFDLPNTSTYSDSGPWAQELLSSEGEEFEGVTDQIRSDNFDNVLGYGRATTGDDPTPHEKSRHLIILETVYECRLHIQIHEDDLRAGNFDKITLDWVDFD